MRTDCRNCGRNDIPLIDTGICLICSAVIIGCLKCGRPINYTEDPDSLLPIATTCLHTVWESTRPHPDE